MAANPCRSPSFPIASTSLRLGATEGELTEALSLVVSQVQYPAVPPCFVGVERVLQVGPIYFGLAQDKLRSIWVTGASLTTTERAIPIAVAPGPGVSVLTVGAVIDASNPPDGLSVLGSRGLRPQRQRLRSRRAGLFEERLRRRPWLTRARRGTAAPPLC